MRVRKMIAVPLAAGAVALVAVIIGPWQAIPKPPALTVISTEPAGVFDERGEMSQVTLSISNQEDSPLPEKEIHVRNFEKIGAIEARVANVWFDVGSSLACSLWPGQKRDHLIVVPAGTDCCRVTLQYTDSSRAFSKRPVKARLGWLAEHLQLAVRSRLPRGFWRFVGFGPDYVPSSNWQTLTLEIPILPIGK